ncbi:MAG: hypothetical protein WAV41_01135 [Microgenomates group bacterium]
MPKNNLLNYQIVYFHPKTFFNKYIKSFCTPSPLLKGDRGGLIIGLGDFFGDITKIRLETITHNQYAQNSIYPFSPINLDISLPPLEDIDERIFTVSEHMGKYNCNWIVYSTELYIRQHAPATKQLFFHLPRSQNATILASQIYNLLNNNQII